FCKIFIIKHGFSLRKTVLQVEKGFFTILVHFITGKVGLSIEIARKEGRDLQKNSFFSFFYHIFPFFEKSGKARLQKVHLPC
ncbi:MAG: hypothetical protein IJW22_01700, partial [Clostridia bacterium]|nr:hypothetical protein [Clostridia bacterium]